MLECCGVDVSSRSRSRSRSTSRHSHRSRSPRRSRSRSAASSRGQRSASRSQSPRQQSYSPARRSGSPDQDQQLEENYRSRSRSEDRRSEASQDWIIVMCDWQTDCAVNSDLLHVDDSFHYIVTVPFCSVIVENEWFYVVSCSNSAREKSISSCISSAVWIFESLLQYSIWFETSTIIRNFQILFVANLLLI